MIKKEKYPIIGNGQYYIEPLLKKSFSRDPAFPHEYYEAKERLSEDIEKIQDTISGSNEIFMDKKYFVCDSNQSLKRNHILLIPW